MSDIALIGERTFLFEKLFQDMGVSFQFLQPGVLGSPFLPQYRMVMIPTGFANPQYSKTLPALQRMKSNISDFIKRGGVLTVFGPLVPEHDYEWLPLPLKYVCELTTQNVAPSEQECSCLLCTSTPECDGYLLPGEGFETVLKDAKGRAILVMAKYGDGIIVATSVHEFPAAEYIKWALDKARPAKLWGIDLDEEMPLFKKSKIRMEVEALLDKKGLILEEKISVMNLESGEAHYFSDYHAALEFLKGKKGRWYITTPGLRKVKGR